MARTTLVRTFLRSVSTTLQDISPQFSRWPEQELVVYTNYGQLSIAKYLPQAGSRVDAIRLKPGTQQDLTRVLAADIIPGDGSAAVDVHGVSLLGINRNQGSDGLTPGRVIRVTDLYTLDTNDPDWHTKTGATVKEFLHDKNMPKTFYVYPGVPASPAVWANVAWLAEPIRVPDGGEKNAEVYLWDGASTTLLGIQDQWVEDLHNYVVAVALMKGSKNFQNLPKAQFHAGLFTASINAQAQVLAGVSPNLKALPMLDQIPEAA